MRGMHLCRVVVQCCCSREVVHSLVHCPILMLYALPLSCSHTLILSYSHIQHFHLNTYLVFCFCSPHFALSTAQLFNESIKKVWDLDVGGLEAVILVPKECYNNDTARWLKSNW